MASKEQTKEIVVKKQGAVTSDFQKMFDPSLGFGASEQVDAEDIKIPKIHLAQALTPQVASKEVALGEYMNSLTKKPIGATIDVYIMDKVKLLQVYYYVQVKKNEVKKEYLGTVNYSKEAKEQIDNGILPEELHARAVNKGLKPEEELALQGDKVLRYSVLSVDEVKEGVAFPYMVDFKRSSYGAGTDLETTLTQMRRLQGLPSCAKVFTLGTEFISEEYDYYVKTVTNGRDITQDEYDSVKVWISEMQANASRYSADESLDEEEVIKDVGPAPAANKKPQF